MRTLLAKSLSYEAPSLFDVVCASDYDVFIAAQPQMTLQEQQGHELMIGCSFIEFEKYHLLQDTFAVCSMLR